MAGLGPINSPARTLSTAPLHATVSFVLWHSSRSWPGAATDVGREPLKDRPFSREPEDATLETAATLIHSDSIRHFGRLAQEYKFDRFWHRFGRSFKRMNHYPEPFNLIDREAARAPFQVMVCNGWQLQNTLGDHYFDPHTNRLTHAGENKVRWIATQAPEQFRTLYVLRGRSSESTAIRVDSVQQQVARVVPGGPMPAVVETGIAQRGTPGHYVDDIYRKAQASQPVPVLPAASGGN